MPEEVTELDVYKNSITKRLFIDTADDNYIVARWCYFHALNVDFSWLAVHCLEKYMKAVLLLNGHSSIGFRDANGHWKPYLHDIVALYDQVNKFASDLLPTMLVKPSVVDSTMWRPESVDEYLKRLYRDGNANNRYQLFGFAHHSGEVFKLDAMVFNIRRVCVKLDAYVFPKRTREEATQRNPTAKMDFSERTSLSRQPDYYAIGGPLWDALNGRRGEEVQQAAMRENFAFCEKGKEPETVQFISAWSDAVLAKEIIRPLKNGTPEQKTRARQLGQWVMENIYLPSDLAAEIRMAMNP
jgi:hypothetical protein